MSSVLVTLGDSWPQGAELAPDQKPYGYFLQQHLDIRSWVNLGEGGTSNEHLILQLQKFLLTNVHTPVTAVFFLTNPARSLYWHGDMFYPASNEELKRQFLHFHEYDSLRTAITVAALQKICETNKIHDYYLPGWVQVSNWLPGTNLGKIYDKGKGTASQMLQAEKHNGEHLVDVQENLYIKPHFCHPNENGHRVIAENLAKWIKYQQGD
jgi:hypothetical protein